MQRNIGFITCRCIATGVTSTIEISSEIVIDCLFVCLFQWLDTVVLNWLTRIYNQGSLKIEPHNARVKDVLKEFRIKLEYYLYETYAHIIIDQFFTVIIGNEIPNGQNDGDKLDLNIFIIV